MTERPSAGVFDLTGRVAVVTGGNGGIGLGMAEALAGAGCAISVWGRDEAKNRRALDRLEATGAPVAAEICDVADPAAVQRAFDATLARFGRVDGLFANAGVAGGGRRSFLEREPEEWRRTFAVNLDGVVASFQVAARHMAERAGRGDAFGRLVATSSVASLLGAARNEHYGATKGALNAMVRALAVELARYGVTANAILPGWIESDMTAGLMANEKFVNFNLPRIPARRFGRPEDFGGIAVYLMSGASAYHTGQVLVIDGGYTVA
ncbi:NAD(P)-dependent dehydrogenase, short-chain alcohol dehydrogenase family [Methylobacterium sp. 174MFSha1.1]|uniref:SDR family NAD(P)-dependent oxidoreductase n=1 Tax=Methylobacterium sp. 174MFSha1.1 TaxID=1502749 RepID=UPI0008EF44E1|nr:SDR family oxidoreductase [Methylobacterium sp. 174MFSha1.1]SFV12650.1 NAD(P)-dependent dehydrogenase, short-chain alcohol dehydrogenase family [Methylobacterium sp. 174MFSha1.1]